MVLVFKYCPVQASYVGADIIDSPRFATSTCAPPRYWTRALAAVVVGCGLDIEVATKLTERVFQECRGKGTAFKLL